MAINFPDSPGIGSVFTDTTSGFSYEWTGTLWKSYSANTVSNIQILDDISGSFNTSDTTFNLTVGSSAVTPANAQQIEIILGGIQQSPGVDYTISGSTVIFTTAPTNGLTFSGKLLGTALSLNTIPANTDGSNLVSLNASELDSGTVPVARLSGVTTNLISAIGIQSGGTAIGSGITQLNFVGTGNTFAVNGTTVDISIQGGGGGGGAIGIQSGGSRVAYGITDVNIAIGSRTSRNITGSGTTATVSVDIGEYYIFRKAAVGYQTMRVLVAGSNGGIAKSDYLGGSVHVGVTTINTDQFPWVAGIGISISPLGHLIFTVP